MKKIQLAAMLFLMPFYMMAQLISGQVKDEKTNETLSGVTIQIKGTNKGTRSDGNGRYTIKAKPKEVLLVSYLGYVRQEITINGETRLDINLVKSDGTTMKAVTVVGSRKPGRTNTESAVPIDVIDMSSVSRQSGKMDVNQMLQFAAPSFNANKQSGSDGADHIESGFVTRTWARSDTCAGQW